jgi:hypothetical protein
VSTGDLRKLLAAVERQFDDLAKMRDDAERDRAELNRRISAIQAADREAAAVAAARHARFAEALAKLEIGPATQSNGHLP